MVDGRGCVRKKCPEVRSLVIFFMLGELDDLGNLKLPIDGLVGRPVKTGNSSNLRFLISFCSNTS